MKVNFKYLDDRIFAFRNRVKNLGINLTKVYSRRKAHKFRKAIVSERGSSVMNRHIKKEIKQYAKKRFGSAAYWPWIALYTETRGEFVEGWLPYDYFRYVLLPVMNKESYGNISDQKTFDHRLFGDFAIEPLYVFISGMFYNAKMERVSIPAIRTFMSDYTNKIVVKEEYGIGGKQIQIMDATAFEPEKLDKKLNYVIQPFIRQYKVLHDLYPDSVNTFRVTTYLRKDGNVDVKFVVLRFGIDGRTVDNLTSGGRYVFFDSEGKPSDKSYSGFPLVLNDSESHENTGFRFSDIKIPMFHKMLEKCIEAHLKYPYLRLIGWDVCIEESGEPKLIEWNGFNVMFKPIEAQFGPFWPNDKEF